MPSRRRPSTSKKGTCVRVGFRPRLDETRSVFRKANAANPRQGQKSRIRNKSIQQCNSHTVAAAKKPIKTSECVWQASHQKLSPRRPLAIEVGRFAHRIVHLRDPIEMQRPSTGPSVASRSQMQAEIGPEVHCSLTATRSGLAGRPGWQLGKFHGLQPSGADVGSSPAKFLPWVERCRHPCNQPPIDCGCIPRGGQGWTSDVENLLAASLRYYLPAVALRRTMRLQQHIAATSMLSA